MANITIRIDGLRELGDSIRRMNKKVGNKLIRSAVKAGADLVVRTAKGNAPKKTGKLKKSISSRRDILNSKAGSLETRAVSVFKTTGVYGDTPHNRRKGLVGRKFLQDGPTFYWKFNELGTVKQPARPFIQPALSNNIQAVTDVIANRLRQGILEENT